MNDLDNEFIVKEIPEYEFTYVIRTPHRKHIPSSFSEVESGESGAVGIGLLDLLVNTPDFQEFTQELKIGPTSNVLLFNTEGATDPENYREILWHGKYTHRTI